MALCLDSREDKFIPGRLKQSCEDIFQLVIIFSSTKVAYKIVFSPLSLSAKVGLTLPIVFSGKVEQLAVWSASNSDHTVMNAVEIASLIR